MEVKEKGVEIILGFIILIFAYWQTGASTWIIVAAALLLILNALFGKRNNVPDRN